MEFSSQEYWSRLPFPITGDLPNPGIEPLSPVSPALAGRFFTTGPPAKPCYSKCEGLNIFSKYCFQVLQYIPRNGIPRLYGDSSFNFLKIWYVLYTKKYYSALTKKEILTLATTWTVRALCKWVKSDRKKQMSYDITYMWGWKKSQAHKDKVEWWLPGTRKWGYWEDVV